MWNHVYLCKVKNEIHTKIMLKNQKIQKKSEEIEAKSRQKGSEWVKEVKWRQKMLKIEWKVVKMKAKSG